MSLDSKPELLVGNFKNIFKSAEELEEPEEGRIEGEIPSWLNGSFVRTAPGKFDLKSTTDEEWVMNHWFDGYAILYKFDIDSKEKRVKFQKKYLQSDVYKRAMEFGKPMVTEFGTKCFPDPKKGWISRLMSNFMPIEITDNGMGMIYKLGNEVFATSDSCYITGIDLNTLDTCKRHDLNKICGANMLTPHPLEDPEDGSIYNVGFSLGTAGSKFIVVKIPKPNENESTEDMLKKLKVITTFSCRFSTAMPINHSFGLTERYIILVEILLVIPVTSLAACAMNGSCFQTMTQWRGDEVTSKFHILDKTTGKSVSKLSFESSEPFFFWHMINCYEDEDNQLVVDVNCYPTPSVVHSMMLADLRQNIITASDPSQPLRFVVPLPNPEKSKELPQENVNLVTIKTEATAVRTGNVVTLTPTPLSNEMGMEFPSINRNYCGKKYNMFYGGSCYNNSIFTNGIGKMTPAKNQTEFWKSTHHEFPGEPIFVSNPQAKEDDEDDGVILSGVTDVREDKDDFLLILDAKTMKEIARANFKASIPQGLHGTFIPNETPS